MTKVHSFPGITTATGKGRKLDSSRTERNGVIVGDDAGVAQAKQTVEVDAAVEPAKRYLLFASGKRKAGIVIPDELVQNAVSLVWIAGSGKPKFAGKAILKRPPEAFDTALCLRAQGGDLRDAQLFHDAAQMRRRLASSELLLNRPVGSLR